MKWDHNTELQELSSIASKFEMSALSQNSKKSYLSDFHDFTHWCKRFRRESLPASANTVALYLTKMSTHLKVSSLKRRIFSINKMHEEAGHISPTTNPKVKSVLKGIIRKNWEKQKHATPTLIEDIQKISKTLDSKNIKEARDKALLLLGFAGGFRRSELVALNIEDLCLAKEGLVVAVNKSKTDQTGRGRMVPITYGSNADTCPVTALLSYITFLNRTSGFLFCSINRWGHLSNERLTDQSVRLILKGALKKAGIKEQGFSGHSLRAGFVTVASINGASERDIQKSTGHASVEVLRRYIRDANIFRDAASTKLGL